MSHDSWKVTHDAGSNGCAYVGQGVTFKGSISVPQRAVVHGIIEGDVESRELLVGPTGTIKGSVRVTEADIQGRVGEHIEAKGCLSLCRTGRVEGAVHCGEIRVEEGGVLLSEDSN